MSQPLRVGLVGCGIATQALHLPALASLARRFSVTAVCDASEAVADEVAARCGARPIADPFALVEAEDVDVVCVCTPDAVHLDHALAAVEARRRAVLVEKPMTLNARMGRILADASEKYGVPVLVEYPHVYDAAARRALAAFGDPARLRSGEFFCQVGPNDAVIADAIEPIRPSGPPDAWAGLLAQLEMVTAATEVLGTAVGAPMVVGYGLTLGLTIHDIPLLRRFAGPSLRVAWARFRPAANPIDVAGFGIDAALETPSATLFLQSEFHPLKRTEWGFRVRRGDLHAEVRYPTTFAPAAPSRCTLFREEDGATHESTTTDLYETGFRRIWRHVHDVVIRGAAPETPARDAIADLELVEAIARAAVAGGVGA